MIDFRYHLVSLVSVFLALAVGVVLGAGPLRGEVSDRLNDSLTELRAEKNQLREELNVAQGGNSNRDKFLGEVTPALLGNRLTGRRVALIELPNADRGAAGDLTDTLTAAGAQVTAEVELREAWDGADGTQARADATEKLRPLMATLGLAAEPDVALSRALVQSSAPAASVPAGNDQLPRQLLDVLSKAGLVNVHKAPAARADLLVVVAPPVESAAAATSSTGATPSATASSSATGSATAPDPAATLAWATFAESLDRAGRGVVVFGPASSAAGNGVLAAIRSDSDVAKRVSTVDTLGSPMGDITTGLALLEQEAGGAGAYGFARGAGAALPANLLSTASAQ